MYPFAFSSAGDEKTALRFTIASNHIRPTYVWPARHLTSNGQNVSSQPPMGQLFRLKASFAIPANYSTQSKAILQAIRDTGDLADEIAEKLNAELDRFKQGFNVQEEASLVA